MRGHRGDDSEVIMIINLGRDRIGQLDVLEGSHGGGEDNHI